MKRLICLAMVAMLCVMSVCSSALAVAATYPTTQSFVSVLDDNDIMYTLVGLVDGDNEKVTVSNQGEEFSYTINYFFDVDQEITNIRVWDIITYDPANLADVVYACNVVNSRYNFARFYADESDNTVTCAMDVIYLTEDAGEVVMNSTLYLVSVLDAGYAILKEYNQ